MLRETILRCPDKVWDDPTQGNRFWHIAYHTLFYTHFYLSPSEGEFEPWEYGIRGMQFFRSYVPAEPDGTCPYTKEQLLAYTDRIATSLESRIAAEPFADPSGFEWLPFSRLELHLYNIRHVQHHTGQLVERLRGDGIEGIEWEGWWPQDQEAGR